MPASSNNSDSIAAPHVKSIATHADLEKQATNATIEPAAAPKSLGAGVCLHKKTNEKFNANDSL